MAEMAQLKPKMGVRRKKGFLRKEENNRTINVFLKAFFILKQKLRQKNAKALQVLDHLGIFSGPPGGSYMYRGILSDREIYGFSKGPIR